MFNAYEFRRTMQVETSSDLSFQARARMKSGMPESSKQRVFLESAVITFTYYLNWMNYRSSNDPRRGALKSKAPAYAIRAGASLRRANVRGGREARATLSVIWVALFELPH
jgi:hypothetical protein